MFPNVAYGWIRRWVFRGRGYNLANLKPTTVVPPTLLTANLICMFILHNVAKNCVKSKRDKWTRRCHPSETMSDVDVKFIFFSAPQLVPSFIQIFSYDFAAKIRFECTCDPQRERESECRKNPLAKKKNKKWKTNFTLNNAVFPFPPTPICIRNLSGATGVPGLHRTEQGWASSSLGWLQQLQMAA